MGKFYPTNGDSDQQHPPQQKQQPERRTSSAAVEAKDNIPHEGENPVVGGQGTSDAAKGEAGERLSAYDATHAAETLLVLVCNHFTSSIRPSLER